MAVPYAKGMKAKGEVASKASPAFEIVPPADTPEYMCPAYFGCLNWAITSDEILAHFEKETGRSFSLPKCALDLMIDQAAGYDPMLEFIKAFVPWFNEWIWGPVEQKEPADG